MAEIIKGTIMRNDKGEIIVEENHRVTCKCDGGLQFQFSASDVDLNGGPVTIRIDGKEIVVPLGNSAEQAINKNVANKNKEDLVEIESSGSKNFHWCDASTKLFLDLYNTKREMVSNRKMKNLKLMWKLICEEMLKAGYTVTPLQVENKFKTLERSYKNMVSNNKKTGRGRVGCSYEKELEEILGKRHSIVPLAVSGRDGLKIRNETANIMDESFEMEFLDESVVMQTSPVKAPSMSTELEENNSANANKNNSVLEAAVPATFSLGQKKTGGGTTAKALENCQTELQEHRKTIVTCHEYQNATQLQMLEEYRKIRKIQEEFTVATNEHREAIRQQREETNYILVERNNLLREVIEVMKNNQNE